jgi:hypothetical protein
MVALSLLQEHFYFFIAGLETAEFGLALDAVK